ncbi:Hsp20/alpha crystallin family protein [Haloarculaceae archaeon H-GB2-1]|nr:Hsp20/alpha crystallin family protein [Haloarculaceae archaeon H-GB1-1]MEA5389102.1 Hsp20/alpha crystallin family protein [Haloarculaceae archaeon H-GB11]MEA5407163.1 Hsp20/alpha crystallin family protein [Haloarculaceae archaeon H-GB2-1]
MRRDDRDDPFDEFFDEIERMMNDMMSDANVHIERGPNQGEPTGSEGPGVHLDVFEEGDELRVVADLPGVDKDDIGLKCDGETLTIDAKSEVREYHERVPLPVRVDEHSADASYNNGILEVSFDTAGDTADIDLE